MTPLLLRCHSVPFQPSQNIQVIFVSLCEQALFTHIKVIDLIHTCSISSSTISLYGLCNVLISSKNNSFNLESAALWAVQLSIANNYISGNTQLSASHLTQELMSVSSLGVEDSDIGLGIHYCTVPIVGSRWEMASLAPSKVKEKIQHIQVSHLHAVSCLMWTQK